MSFGEFYAAGKGLFGAYQEGADQAEAARLLDQQLTAALAAQQGQAAPMNGLTALGSGPTTQPQVTQPMAPLGARRVPSFAGGNSAPMMMPGSGGENENKFVGALKEGGLTNPYGLGALAAYASRESGYKGSNITGSWSDPSESGAPGMSGGILSWRGDRLANMRKFTSGAQDPVVAQAKFTLTENPQLTLALQNAKSPEEANALMAQAWKFAGWNREGGENAARLNATRAYVAKLGGAQPGTQPGVQATQIATAAPAGVSAPRMAGMPLPQMPQATSQQVAQADVNPADLPVPNAQPVGFQIPGEAPQSDFVPGTVASPAIQQQGGQGGGMGLAPAAAQRLSPDQVTNLRAMLRNPNTQGYAAKIIEGLNKPSEFSFQVVGDQLIRTSKDGRAEVVPNITKPATLSVVKGSDGNDYVFNPQTGAMTRALEGKDKQFVDLVTPEERARAGVDPTYKGAVQRGPNNELKFPGKAPTEISLTSEKAQDSKIGGAYGETFNNLQDGGRSAAGQLNTLRLMEKLVENPNFYSGTQSGAFLAAKRAAASFGVKGAEDAAAPNELFAKLATQSLLDKAGGSLGAGISNADVATINRTIANPENTKEGNRQIIQFGKALAQRQIDVAKLARDYAVSHNGRLDPGFDDVLSSWAEAHPLNLELTQLQKQQQDAEARGVHAPAQDAGRAPAQVPSQAATPPSAAVDYLRQNMARDPNLRGAFDAKYGAGAADRVLRGASGGVL